MYTKALFRATTILCRLNLFTRLRRMGFKRPRSADIIGKDWFVCVLPAFLYEVPCCDDSTFFLSVYIIIESVSGLNERM